MILFQVTLCTHITTLNICNLSDFSTQAVLGLVNISMTDTQGILVDVLGSDHLMNKNLGSIVSQEIILTEILKRCYQSALKVHVRTDQFLAQN